MRDGADPAALAEAYKRGILPDDMKAPYEEAMRRGLVGGAQAEAPSAATPAAPQRSDLAQIGHQLARGTRNVVEGIASPVLGIIGNPLNEVVNAGIRGVNSVTGASIPQLQKPTDALHQNLVASGLPDAESADERFQDRLQSAAASGLTGPLAAATKAGQVAGPVATTVMDALGAQPATQVAGAVGGDLAANAVPDKVEIAGHDVTAPAKMAAALAGGLGAAGGYAGTKSAGRYVGRVANDLAAPLTEAGQQRIAGQALRDASVNPGAAIDAAENATTLVPGSAPTLAEATGDTGLAVAQRGNAASSPTAAARMTERADAQNTARRAELGAISPGAENAHTVAQAIRDRMAGFQGATDEIIGRASERASQQIAALGGDTTSEAAGRIIRDEFQAAHEAAKAKTSAAYARVGEATVPIADARVGIQDAQGRYFGKGSGEMPAPLASLVQDVHGMGTATELTTIQNLQSRASEMASQFRMSGDARAAAMASRVQAELDAALAGAAEHTAEGQGLTRTLVRGEPTPGVAERAAGEGMTPEQQAALGDARAARAEQGATLERGAMKNLARDGERGSDRIPDSGVAQQFFFAGRGSPEAASQFVTALGDRPAAVTALRDFAATSLRDFASNPDGTINAARWRTWMDRHAGALRQFPELYQQMNTAGNAARTVESLVGRQAQTVDQLERSAAGYFLKQNPQDAVASVLGSKNSAAGMRQLVATLKNDPVALNGLRRAILDHLDGASSNAATDAAGEAMLSPAKFGRAVRENRETLRVAFSGQDLARIEAIAADLDRGARAATAGRGVGSNTVQNLTTANLIGSALGPLKKAAPIVARLAKPLEWLYSVPEKQIQQLMTDAMLDPALGAKLMRQAAPKEVVDVSRVLRTRAAALGIPVAAAEPHPRRPEMIPAMTPALQGAH